MKSFEKHYADYVEAVTYDYPRGEVTIEGFVEYLGRVAVPTLEETRAKELIGNYLAGPVDDEQVLDK